MTCAEAREALWPDPHASDPGPALSHYLACAACRQFFVWQGRLGLRLQGLATEEIPTLVRARVRKGLSGAAARRRRHLWVTAAVAAAVMVTVFLGRPANPAADFAPAARHLVDMPMDSAPDLVAASGWLSDTLSMAMNLPAIEGAHFMGAHIMKVGGAMGAAARYDYKGMNLAYFAVPAPGMPADSGMASAGVDGWEVAMWHEEGRVHALAGEHPMTREEIVAMARACRSERPQQVALRS